MFSDSPTRGGYLSRGSNSFGRPAALSQPRGLMQRLQPFQSPYAAPSPLPPAAPVGLAAPAVASPVITAGAPALAAFAQGSGSKGMKKSKGKRKEKKAEEKKGEVWSTPSSLFVRTRGRRWRRRTPGLWTRCSPCFRLKASDKDERV